ALAVRLPLEPSPLLSRLRVRASVPSLAAVLSLARVPSRAAVRTRARFLFSEPQPGALAALRVQSLHHAAVPQSETPVFAPPSPRGTFRARITRAPVHGYFPEHCCDGRSPVPLSTEYFCRSRPVPSAGLQRGGEHVWASLQMQCRNGRRIGCRQDWVIGR